MQSSNSCKKNQALYQILYIELCSIYAKQSVDIYCQQSYHTITMGQYVVQMGAEAWNSKDNKQDTKYIYIFFMFKPMNT